MRRRPGPDARRSTLRTLATRADQVDGSTRLPGRRVAVVISPCSSSTVRHFVAGPVERSPVPARHLRFTSSMARVSALDFPTWLRLASRPINCPRDVTRTRPRSVPKPVHEQVFASSGLVTSSATGNSGARSRSSRGRFVGLTLLGGLTYAGSASLKSTLARRRILDRRRANVQQERPPVDPGIGTLVGRGTPVGETTGNTAAHRFPELLPADEYYQYRGARARTPATWPESPACDENRRRATFLMELRRRCPRGSRCPLIFRPPPDLRDSASTCSTGRDRRRERPSPREHHLPIPRLGFARAYRQRRVPARLDPGRGRRDGGTDPTDLRCRARASAPESVEAMLQLAASARALRDRGRAATTSTGIAAAVMEMTA